jgi:hypothetical protein
MWGACDAWDTHIHTYTHTHIHTYTHTHIHRYTHKQLLVGGIMLFVCVWGMLMRGICV